MVWLSIFWISVVLAIVFLILTPFLSRGKNVVECIVTTVLLLIVSHFSATLAFGYGKVTPKAEEFSERLDNSIAYELASSTRDGASFVLLLREFGTSNFRYIRTNTTPPEIFTLIDGKPVAIQPR